MGLMAQVALQALLEVLELAGLRVERHYNVHQRPRSQSHVVSKYSLLTNERLQETSVHSNTFFDVQSNFA